VSAVGVRYGYNGEPTRISMVFASVVEGGGTVQTHVLTVREASALASQLIVAVKEAGGER
jgi:hypothetical protein